MLCAAILMRAIQHLPHAVRLDSDSATYAWYDLAQVTGLIQQRVPEVRYMDPPTVLYDLN